MKRRNFLNNSALTALGLGVASCASPTEIAASDKTILSNDEGTGVSFRIEDLAPKPMLGWNSFDSYGVYLYEQAAMENLEAFAEKLMPHGYEYFVIDGGWHGEYKLRPGTIFPQEKHASDLALDEYGLPEPSKTYWPNGFGPLFKRAKELGVKLGVHLMRGIPRKAVKLNLPVKGTEYGAADVADTNSICKWCHHNYGVNIHAPGAQAYYDALFKKLADWGIDFVKVDDLIPYPDEVVMVADAIERCGRPMVYSLSPGGGTNARDLPYYRRANAVRITADIWDEPEDFTQAFERWREFQGTGHPGFWPDLDMIPFGKLQVMNPKYGANEEQAANLAGKGNTRDSKLTNVEKETFISMRALCASPLMMGGDLPTLDDFSLKLITDPDMLACDQNGQTGILVYDKDKVEVWQANKTDIFGEGWFGVFNRTEEQKSVMLSAKQLKLSFLKYVGLENTNFIIKDIWNEKMLTMTKAGYKFDLPPNGVVFAHYQGGGRTS